MDFATLKAQIDASRKTTESVAGITFDLLLPTQYAVRVAFEAEREGGRLVQARVSRALLEGAVVGWSGLTARHLLAEAPQEPVEFSVEARTLLLDGRQDIADELSAKVYALTRERREQLEAAEKN